MLDDSQLREKLRKIEALFAGAGTAGERSAAEAALARIRAKLDEIAAKETAIEMQFSLADYWSRLLFVALCRRYGLEPYRRYRQRHTTVLVCAPRRFVHEVLWPEYKELSAELQKYLHEVTLRLIRESVHSDASEAPEIGPALPAPQG